ncbi:hypothetical protein BKA83DRAFT_1960443 [Pisolithus microcarpus]|nr:hypothetical protein BKA83DRAFT_1960443 [Pisolithus microcarpus]
MYQRSTCISSVSIRSPSPLPSSRSQSASVAPLHVLIFGTSTSRLHFYYATGSAFSEALNAYTRVGTRLSSLRTRRGGIDMLTETSEPLVSRILCNDLFALSHRTLRVHKAVVVAHNLGGLIWAIFAHWQPDRLLARLKYLTTYVATPHRQGLTILLNLTRRIPSGGAASTARTVTLFVTNGRICLQYCSDVSVRREVCQRRSQTVTKFRLLPTRTSTVVKS